MGLKSAGSLRISASLRERLVRSGEVEEEGGRRETTGFHANKLRSGIGGHVSGKGLHDQVWHTLGQIYHRFVMSDLSGVSGSSEYVVYNTLTVQDGVLREPSWKNQHLFKMCEVLAYLY